MLMHNIDGIAAFIDSGFIRDDPDFIKGIDRNIGGTIFLLGLLIDLVPKFFAQAIFRIYQA